MVYSSGAKRSRYSNSIVNQCQGGGSKKAGLISRVVPSAVSIMHLGGGELGSQGHHRSLPQSMIMMPHQKNVTGGMGTGRKVKGIRHSAWNTIGTSAKAGYDCA
jgi:hypothetical protein